MEKSTPPNVAVLLFPWASKAPYYFVSDIIKILEPISEQVYVISGHEERIKYQNKNVKIFPVKLAVHYAKTKRPLWFSYILWILKCFLIQINMCFNLIRILGDIDIVIYMAYPFNLLPLIIAKIFRKKNIELIIRSEERHHNRLLKLFLDINNILDFKLMDTISPESKSLVKEFNLDKYQKKVVGECSRFVEIDKINVLPLKNRKNVIGFIGRLRKEKGIIEFVKSIPIILNERKDVEFLIIGEGDMSKWVKSQIKDVKKNHNAKIKFLGWVPREDIFDVLVSLKILVMPTTHAEGLPTIILESMASGTPVLTTNVGGIPDVIQDRKTGFIMESNSPEYIARGVINALEHNHLDKIVKNARKVVEKKFTYKNAVKRWEKILSF